MEISSGCGLVGMLKDSYCGSHLVLGKEISWLGWTGIYFSGMILAIGWTGESPVCKLHNYWLVALLGCNKFDPDIQVLVACLILSHFLAHLPSPSFVINQPIRIKLPAETKIYSILILLLNNKSGGRQKKERTL